MTTFDDRERAYESKFVLDQDQEFKATSRRNRLLGHWAGEVLGKSGEALAEYAREVVRSDFERPGEDDVARKVEADLAGRPEAAQVRSKMAELMLQARESVATDVVGHN
jgi:hypothetical protein